VGTSFWRHGRRYGMRKCQRTAQEGDNNWSLKERLKNNKEKRKKKKGITINC
jgi:translation elongation factor EF-1alpha